MKFQITLTQFNLKDEFPEHWSPDDYRALLDAVEYGDTSALAESELREMLFLALTDLEPDEAARIVLTHALGDALSEGQIDQISHEMQVDKISEEYSNIALHYTLFHVNALLYKAFNGTFPHAKASIVSLELKPLKAENYKVDKTTLLKALHDGLSDRSVLKRLFADQLATEAAFPDAEHILWDFQDLGKNQYQLTTSEYWLDQADFTEGEFVGTVVME